MLRNIKMILIFLIILLTIDVLKMATINNSKELL